MNSRERSGFFCRFHRRHNRFRYVVSIVTIYSFMFLNMASAQQIVIDGQTQTQLTINQNVTDVTTSTIHGQNAFNSFSKFDVYQGNVVNLHVPNSAQNLLNMVHDSQTNIDGILNSIKNGQIGGNVFFANPHGFVVGAGGMVNVGSLTAITPTRSFMENFFDGPGQPNLSATSQLLSGSAPINSEALISIQGKINALTDITLAAGSISNYGMLASGAVFDGYQADFSDIVNINDIEIGTAITVDVNGDIVISAQEDFLNSGTIITDGSDNLDAGNIDIYAGRDISLAGGSLVSAAGRGTDSGGGNINIWADNNASARAGAKIDARGGDVSGDGGFIEFSAKKVVDLENAHMSAAAADGDQGTVLIDPLELNIDQFSGGGNLEFQADDSINVHENTTISSYQAGGAAGDISFTAPIIDIRSGAEILANADPGYDAGDIFITAESSVSLPLQTAEARINVLNATIDGGNVTFSTNASSTDMLGIEAFTGANAIIDIDNSTITADGNITMTASSDIDAMAAGTPVDLAVDAAVVDADARAEVNLRNSIVQVNDGNIIIDAASNINSEALADASSSGSVAVDAAVAVSAIDSSAIANIEDSSLIFTNSGTETGGLGLATRNSVNVTTTANGTAGGENAAGATVAVGVVNTNSQVSLEGNTTVSGSNNINLLAQSDSHVQTAAIATAGGSQASGDSSNQSEQRLSEYNAETNEGSIDVAGAVAISDVSSFTQADISSTGAVVAADAIDLRAEATTNSSTTANGSATGGDIGVGVAVGLNIASATNRAFIGDQANVSGGSIGIKALMDANDASNDFSAEAISGAGASNVGVAGSLAMNIVTNKSEAFIEGDENNNDLFAYVDADGETIILEAVNTSNSTVNAAATVTGEGENAEVGVGATVGMNIAVNQTRAEVEDEVDLSGIGSASLTAASDHTMTTDATGGAAGGVAVTPLAALSISVNETRAQLGSGSEVVIGDGLTAEAEQKSSVTTTATGQTEGSNVAVGASLGLTVAVDTVTATTGRDIAAGTGDVSFTAKSDVSSGTKATASVSGGKPADENGEAAPGEDVNSQVASQRSFASSQSSEAADGTSGADTPTADTDDSGGSVSVAAAIGVNVGVSNTTAYIPEDRSVSSTGGELNLTTVATTDASAVAEGKQVDSTGGTAVGVGAAVALNVGVANNTAYIGDDAIINTQGVNLSARTSEKDATEDVINEFKADAVSGAVPVPAMWVLPVRWP